MNFNQAVITRSSHYLYDSAPGEKLTGHVCISTRAWVLLILLTLTTFAAFMLLDPEPSLLLSICAAANVAIITWIIYRLYQWDLLLSPIMTMYAGPAMLMYYSWGNLGARIAGEGRFASQSGLLLYYPLAALLSTLALLLFCIATFGFFADKARYGRIRFQDLNWHPNQLLISISFSFVFLLYLSLKYPFTGGYFRGVEGNFDRWLAASNTSFVMLTTLISISVAAKANSRSVLTLGIFGLVVSLIMGIGLRSRTFMLLQLIMLGLCWISIYPKRVMSTIYMGSLIAVIVFSLGTVVKTANSGGKMSSVVDNLLTLVASDTPSMLDSTQKGLTTDTQYRTAGFEFTAAMLRCLDLGVSPMYGKGLIGGLLQGLPAFIRPAGNFSERGSIGEHFLGRCLKYSDTIGIPLAGGIADWGVSAGLFVYIVAALYSIGLWRIVQSSSDLFVAYLIVPFFPDSLLWDGIFSSIRSIGFAFLVLFILRKWLTPVWKPASNNGYMTTVRWADQRVLK